MSPAEWITILSTIAVAAIHAGIQIGKVSALAARVHSLERGNTDGKRRVGVLERQLAIVEYKLFGRHPTREVPITPEDDKT